MIKNFAKITQQDFEIAATFFENDKHLDEFISNVFRYYFKKPLTIQTKIVKKYFETYKKTMDFIMLSKNYGAKRFDNEHFIDDTLVGVVADPLEPPIPPSLPPNSKEKRVNSKEEIVNSKEKIVNSKEKIVKDKFTPPPIEDVVSFFIEKGYSEIAAKKAFNYYSVANWSDSKGNKIKNWKQKMIGVWFKDENKPQSQAQFQQTQYTQERKRVWKNAN